MSYFPSSDAPDAKEMLQRIGVDDAGALFSTIPEDLRKQATINLPDGIDEAELVAQFRALAAGNRPVTDVASFVGAGIYPYPMAAAALYQISRGEFLTAYTPYQPEIAQGTLMAIFEFQTWIAELSGMPVANASMYDGATALAEAILMGLRVRRKARRIYLSQGLDPATLHVCRLYLAGQPDAEIIDLPLAADGTTQLDAVQADPDDKIVALGSPNGFGVIEDVAAARAILGDTGFLVTHTPDPHVWLLATPPGQLGADVVVAEGQPLGLPPSYGGPLLGLLATRNDFIRRMPGRLCGQTVDADGKPGYVLTLSTREQHIRREKATSNICTNQGIMALLATVTMSTLGPAGLRKRALQSANNAARLEQLLTGNGFTRRHSGPYFNEFVVDHDNAHDIWDRAVQAGVQIGKRLDDGGLLVAATANNSDSDFQAVQSCLK